MEQYLDAVEEAMRTGSYKPNRTKVDTIATFNVNYTIDLDDGYPLLTTKDMSGLLWNSMLNEFFWYLSGQEHIRTLREQSGIWDEWGDDDGHLNTAYGRFWRRYPIPARDGQLAGETWIDATSDYVTEENGQLFLDQIAFTLDALNDENPDRGPESRRLVVNAWHPGNASVSGLPPCHYSFVFNVQDDKLHTHLTQRSADLALGVPFNIACYGLLTEAVAQETEFDAGAFGHTLVDAHVYCGKDDRGAWYADNLDELQDRMAAVDDREEYREIRDWILDEAPEDAGAGNLDEHKYGYDQVPGLLEQLAREPRDLPEIDIPDGWFEQVLNLRDEVQRIEEQFPAYEDDPEHAGRDWYETVYFPTLFDMLGEGVRVHGYDPADGIRFQVAE